MTARKPIVGIAGQLQELPVDDTLDGLSVPISTDSYTVPANTSVVAVDELVVSNELIVEGNLAVI